jgi:16S rRNA (adenine1518-N6/adenine1519-N6)-dimethyltransferase
MDLTNQKTLTAVLKKHGLWAKKRFGQNFLINKEVLQKTLVTGGISKKDHVVEVGPGLGTLTVELCKKAGKVTSIEADKFIIPALKDTTKEFKNLQIIQKDALKVEPPKSKYKVIANIPYNITSPLLSHFLHNKNRPEKIVFLMQKEVAEKITDIKKQSVLSLQVQIFGEPKIIATVPPESFHPAPKVTSSILEINVYKTPLSKNPEKILALAKKAFTLKRKKLRNSIGTNAAEFENRRPETLTIQEWDVLAETISSDELVS